jgi:hypothetical protein
VLACECFLTIAERARKEKVEKDGGGGEKTGKNTAGGRKGGEGAASRTMITKGKAKLQLNKQKQEGGTKGGEEAENRTMITKGKAKLQLNSSWCLSWSAVV